MNKNSYTKIFLISSFFLSVGLFPAFADDANECTNLSDGMTYNEVLIQCGKPLEKIEYETKHEDLWVYKYYSLKFKEGKLLLDKKIIENASASRPKIKKTSPKMEEKDYHEWGAIEPINDNISFEEIINNAVTNEKPEKVMPRFPPPPRRR